MLRIAELFRRRTAPSKAARGKADPLAVPAEGWSWTRHPLVRERINALVSGSRHVDGYGRLAEFLADGGRPATLGACASLGCGTGGLERDLVQRGMVGTIDGYDPSEEAIAEARRLAARAGRGSIRYHAADLAGLALPEGRLDAVFSHACLHGLDELDAVLDGIRRALKPDGILHLTEFVGPSRFQWTDAQTALTNGFLETLPDRLLRTPGGRKPPVERAPLEHVLATQPGRAVRSGEIRAAVARHFHVLEERPYGGTLLHIGLHDIAQNFDPEDAADVAHLERFFALEDEALTTGGLASDFTVLTAAPASASRPVAGWQAPPAPFGAAPTRRLRPPPGLAPSNMDLTVSRADTMLGDSDAHYVAVGQSALAAIDRALEGREPRGILDLPCGFGRVTRALRARFPAAAITVSDLDRPGVDFSARQFGARAAYSVRDFRDLDLGEAYDLIWVGSLATHLPTGQTKHLLSALRRHLAPGGSLLVTLQGPSIIPRLREQGYGLSPADAAAVIAEYERTGFGYRDYGGGEDEYGVSLTNDNYGISLTDETWMAAAAVECGLRLHAYETRSWDEHHDIAVLRRLDGG